MISVGMLGGVGGSTAAVARYYLAGGRSCGLEYYSEHDRAPGRWTGGGADAQGLDGRLDDAGAQRLLELFDAVGPSGEQLAKPVWRANPAGQVPVAPLLAVLHGLARGRGVEVEGLFSVPMDRATVGGVLRRAAAAGEPLATPVAGLARGKTRVDAAVAGHLAAAAGLDPVEVFRAPDGTDVYSAALPHTGERLDTRRAGIDVTVSAPKSVSVLLGLGDPALAGVLEDCHDRAVQQALGYLERHCAHGQRGHHGDGQTMTCVATDGWIVAAFTHHTSRAGDPQLHTHLVVPNLVRGKDGQWSAIDSRAVFRHAKTAGYLYQAALRAELTRELGVTWTTPVKGMAEIEGVPREVLREFSQRRRQIEERLRSTGRKGRDAAQAACLATRQAKQHHTLAELRSGWTKRLAELGRSPYGLLVDSLRRHKPGTPGELDLLALAARILGPEGVTAQATGFDRRDLLQALAVTVPVELGGDAQALENLADQLLARPDAVDLLPGEQDEQRWTTLELLATEHQALTRASTASATVVSDLAHVDQLLTERTWLSADQRIAIRHLVADDRLATVLVGPAGSGKTAVLTAVNDLATRAGVPVIGCALAALTARRLQQGSGIASSSLASLLARLDMGQPLATGTLVVVDEAGMVGTRQLTRLLECARAAGGRVMLVGDPEQLPEIDAGGLFRHLSQPEQHPAVLVGNQRQQNAWETATLEQLRSGHVATAVTSYVHRGRISQLPTREAMHAEVANDYFTATADARLPEQQREMVVLASHNADVRALNQQIREQLQHAGRLALDSLVIETPEGPIAFAEGDQVIVTRQCQDSSGRKVLNGTRGHLTHAADGQLQLQPDYGAAITLDIPEAKDSLRHGYALTIHKAQGLTATRSLVVGDGLTRQSAYTALSRGREHNQLYLHDEEGQRPDARTPIGRLIDQLQRPNGDTLALHQLAAPALEPAVREPDGQTRGL